MKDELRFAIAAFVAACARLSFCIARDREQRRLEVHVAWDDLADAWERHAP